MIVYLYCVTFLIVGTLVQSFTVKKEEIIQPVASDYLIYPNDRILVIGGSNAFIGTAMPYGFAQLLNTESNKILQNITSFNGGSRNEVYNLKTLKARLPNLVKYYAPSKVILLVGLREMNSLDKTIPEIRFDLESILIDLKRSGIEVILCPIDVYAEGEAIPHEENPLDEKIDQLVWITQRIAKDYGVMQIDLHGAMIKYLEHTNIDNLPQFVLTYDGYTLNELGHAFVAQTLAQRLLALSTLDDVILAKGKTSSASQPQKQQTVSSFMMNNLAAVEHRRVSALKNEIRHNEEFERHLLMSVEV